VDQQKKSNGIGQKKSQTIKKWGKFGNFFLLEMSQQRKQIIQKTFKEERHSKQTEQQTDV